MVESCTVYIAVFHMLRPPHKALVLTRLMIIIVGLSLSKPEVIALHAAELTKVGGSRCVR